MPTQPSPPHPAAARRRQTVRTVALVSLGCPKNLVDSEKMLGLLAEDGLTPVSEDAGPDAIVINTCGFLEASKDESLGEIARAAELKKAGKIQRIIVAGCLVQRHRARMLEWCPDIDAMVGVFDRDRIVEAVKGAQSRGTRGPRPSDAANDHPLPVYSSIATNATLARRARGITPRKADGYFESDAARLRLTPRHYAYLRISEGCNQNCAFCTIPSIRGKMRSKPVEAILAEARELIADGTFELNLIGQDTTSYGQDIGYQPPGGGLVGMLTELDKLSRREGAAGSWVRLMYAYPSCFTDAMIDAIASLPSVVKYIDMPLQHISDPILESMRRRTSRKLIETLLGKLRRRVPGIAIRTTFITGFPGETEAHHRELVEFVRDFEFDAMGVFPFSPEPGTPAGTRHAGDPQLAVPADVVQARLDELMRTQQEVVFAGNRALADAGPELDVLIEGATDTTGKHTTGVAKAGKLYAGRTYAQAPQIDATTYVSAREKLAPGELVRCKVVDADGYDLIARPATEVAGTRQVALAVMR